MKTLTIIFALILGITAQAQVEKNIGYITLEGNYNVKDESYDENNIAGLRLTLEQLKYEESGVTTVKIEFIEGGITLLNEYIVTSTLSANDSLEYNVYFLRDIYKNEVLLKYTDTDFEIWSNRHQCNGRKVEWMSYFVGIFIN